MCPLHFLLIFLYTASLNTGNLCLSDLLMFHVSELYNKTDNIRACYKRTLVYLLISFEFQTSPSSAAAVTPVARLILLLMSSSCDNTLCTMTSQATTLIQYIQNVLAHVVKVRGKYDHVTPLL